MDWHNVKQWAETASGLDMDALHVHAGVALQILYALILRRPLSSPWPWLAVAATETANEIYDYRYEVWPDRSIQLAEGIRDGWNTMVIPTLLLLLCRYAPALLVGPRAVSNADAGQSGGEAGERRESAD
jgi:hypothetical protein